MTSVLRTICRIPYIRVKIFLPSESSISDLKRKMIDWQKVGLDRDLNPGPRAPEARIIPLDHQATYGLWHFIFFENWEENRQYKKLYRCLQLLGSTSTAAVVAEWLRRWTWNPMGSARVGSNPANCEIKFCLHLLCEVSISNTKQDSLSSQNKYVRCGVRTHAIFRLWVLKTHALDHSANLTVKLKCGFQRDAYTE